MTRRPASSRAGTDHFDGTGPDSADPAVRARAVLGGLTGSAELEVGRRSASTALTACGPRPPALALLVDDRLRLLPQELLDVVEAAARFAGRGRALPAAERLDTRPGAGCRAGATVHVD